MEIIGTTLFLIGFISSLHCLGMCGGIIAALSLGLPADIRNSRLTTATIVTSFNLGRIISYVIAGAIAGLLGDKFISVLALDYGHAFLQIIAGITLIVIGLHIAGWIPALKWIEAPGIYLWRYLQPIGKHLLPVTNLSRALLIGIIWGWLPCALVYTVLLLAITGGSWIQGSLYMLVFGMGTLPGMFITGMTSSLFRQQIQYSYLRYIAAILIIFAGIITPLFLHDHPVETSRKVNHEHMSVFPKLLYNVT